MGKVADQKIVATNRADETVRGRRLAAGRNFSNVINLIGGELKKCGSELLHLEVNVLEVTPGGSFVATLVDRSAAVIPDLRGEVGEIGEATTTVSQRCVSLEPKVDGGWLPVIKMGDRKDNVPKFEAMIFASAPNRFEVRPVAWAQRTIIHERIVVVTDDARLTSGD